MRVFLTGASGFIGQQLVIALLNARHQVIACTRHPARWQAQYPQVQWIACDYTQDHQPDIWLSRLTNVDIVINAVGIIQETAQQSFEALHTRAPIALFQAAEQLGIRRVLQISALGAEAETYTAYQRSKQLADNALWQLDLDPIIVYPSIVVGRGGGSTSLFSALAALPIIPLIGDGQQRLQPIHITDFTVCILRLIDNWSGRQRLAFVGCEEVRFSDLLQLLRQWLQLPPALSLALPLALITPLAKLNNHLKIGALNRDTLAMLQRGNYADVQPLINATAYTPCPLMQALATQPAVTGDRWQARLWFLRPLLRLSIAFLWIWTGIVSAFLYPTLESYALLAATGVTGALLAPLALYGSALLDFVLGLATLFAYRLRWVVFVQCGLMLGYTILISYGLSELWLHPFGAISKNLPLLVATLILLVLEER
ncbi:nucleoside-diphosphate-sugar epimerase [Beggiatoa alba B18LD]|uniref:Nucleoside-diphosphate-sugar epimerase n=1 Tax=Beggiatoa alba B18LD TaxID=395493 RepID=I3CJB2_9GAMM|nr:SDR family oxidoreductase [Beggiatoa alba]EIJ43705.1 nucleoside-diphosphate-sugar epimerase [Beggiatoa alba B18LD]